MIFQKYLIFVAFKIQKLNFKSPCFIDFDEIKDYVEFFSEENSEVD